MRTRQDPGDSSCRTHRTTEWLYSNWSLKPSWITSELISGIVKINPQMMRLRKGVDVLIATPGRLLDLHQQNAVAFDQLEVLDTLNGLHINRKGWLSFMRKDYCAPHISDLQTAILAKANTLSDGEEITGEVFFLGQTRTLNVYFSPVNFYYIRREGEFSHMLAEVSNTPWNERHYYLVDLKEQAPTQKAFHVSPFNPMDMTYHWQISEPAETLKLVLSCHREDKEFVAGIALKRSELSVKNLRQLRRQIPSMTLKTVIGIYWQAVKLFIKRTPFYGHPGKPDNPPAIQSEK